MILSCKKDESNQPKPLPNPVNPSNDIYSCNDCITCVGKYSIYYKIRYNPTTGDSLGIDSVNVVWINKDCSKRKPYVKCSRIDYCPFYKDIEVLYLDKNGNKIILKP